MEPILDVKELTKDYAQFRAVDNVSFFIKEGEIVGLLGPNGAGKTTTIQMLLGLTTPTSGSISYFGKEFMKHRAYIMSRINFASAYNHVQGRMTVWQNLNIYARLYGLEQPDKRIDEVLSLLDIEEGRDMLFWKLSSGQKTRVILAKALLNHPRLILMDEPTASLDPEIANKVIELVLHLQKHEKVGILYTSHNMEEVERLCDRVIFLYHGRIIAEDTPLGLTKRVGDTTLSITFDGASEVVENYLVGKKFTFEFPRPQVVSVRVPEKVLPKVLFGLSREGVWLTNIEIEKPDLEDVFLSIAGGTYELGTN